MPCLPISLAVDLARLSFSRDSQHAVRHPVPHDMQSLPICVGRLLLPRESILFASPPFREGTMTLASTQSYIPAWTHRSHSCDHSTFTVPIVIGFLLLSDVYSYPSFAIRRKRSLRRFYKSFIVSDPI